MRGALLNLSLITKVEATCKPYTRLLHACKQTCAILEAPCRSARASHTFAIPTYVFISNQFNEMSYHSRAVSHRISPGAPRPIDKLFLYNASASHTEELQSQQSSQSVTAVRDESVEVFSSLDTKVYLIYFGRPLTSWYPSYNSNRKEIRRRVAPLSSSTDSSIHHVPLRAFPIQLELSSCCSLACYFWVLHSR